jgi:hypothetical protein
MMSLYRISQWDTLYETHETRKIKKALAYVKLPNRFDGAGYRRLMTHEDGLTIFGAWILILEVASRCPIRGTLADANGPYTAEDIAMKTGTRAEQIEKALGVLSHPRIGWIEELEEHANVNRELAVSSGKIAHSVTAPDCAEMIATTIELATGHTVTDSDTTMRLVRAGADRQAHPSLVAKWIAEFAAMKHKQGNSIRSPAFFTSVFEEEFPKWRKSLRDEDTSLWPIERHKCVKCSQWSTRFRDFEMPCAC